ncbi:hypothetical protein [Nocardioides sp. LML1-1-1.1]|uniref:hypothetical protein n=1 Tax=Nocardioides sp. LML1-1-1.1 TaxID=3135248 RepID=UPI003438ACE5
MNYENYERRLPGTPTVRTWIHRFVGGLICRHRGHRPTMVEVHHYVAVGPRIPMTRLDTANQPDFQPAVQFFGVRTEKRQGREVRCRTCLAPCGDTIPEAIR